MVQNLDIVILCGGRGVRMGALTAQRQKCMLEINDRPMLAHVLDTVAEALGTARVILVVAYRAQDILRHFGDRYRNLSLNYLDSGQISGTREALLRARSAIRGDFVKLDGNVIFESHGLASVVEQSGKRECDATLLVSTSCDEAPTHGAVALKGRRVSRFVYPAMAPRTSEGRDMGVAAMRRASLNQIARHKMPSLQSVLSRMAGGLRIEAVVYGGPWSHIASVQDLVRCRRRLA